MGISCFICAVPTRDALARAMRAVLAHNAAPAHKEGDEYTEEEFAVLDPKRAAAVAELKPFWPTGQLHAGCMERWTRGEDIRMDKICLVRFRGALWLEAVNGGGGACSTRWLKSNAPGLEWIGTECKPPGWFEAPCVCQAESLGELADAWSTLALSSSN